MNDPQIDWLLTGEPRPAQTEALLRSYRGISYKDKRDGEPDTRHLPWFGGPASGFGFFMQMRTGKTPTALNEYMLFKRDFGVNRFFMFAPNKYKYTWRSEANVFGVDIEPHVFESTKKKDFQKYLRDIGSGEGGVIVNYEALTYPENVALLAEFINDKTYMGADESVLIKNPQANFTKQAILLSKRAAVTRPMTGLPSPQSVCDLWSQLRFARKLDGMNFYQFRGTFANMGGFKNRKVVSRKNEDKLEEILSTHTFRARRGDWGTQIATDYDTQDITMLPPQKKAYEEMDKDFITWLENGDGVSADQVITKRMKLQQIASGFVIDEHGKPRELVPFEKTPKFKDLIGRLENEVNGKIIVIAHYTHTITQLYEKLAKYGVTVIAGNQTMKKLGDLDAETEKKRFNEDPKTQVMIGQSQAIKYGHTLMGTAEDPCLSIAFFENNYSLDNRSQTEERPQGEGQLDAIWMLDYISAPIERDIIKALQDKKSVAEAIMGYYK